jgi:hypothetical protein
VLGDTRSVWTAVFVGDGLKTIREEVQERDFRIAKNKYCFGEGRLRLYDSQRFTIGPAKRIITLHILFDSAGHVTKFSKRDDGRAVAIGPAEAQEALARAAVLAAEARRAAGVPAAR